MNGDQILDEFRAQKDLKSIIHVVQDYLLPRCNGSTRSAVAQAKVEIFSLKLLKLCTEQLPRVSGKGQRSLICSIGSMCIDSLSEASGVSGKSPKLTFEKILLHYCRACLVCESLDEGEKAGAVLYDRLSKDRKHSKEETNLLKHVYDILWKASIQHDSASQAADKSLDLRKLALNCLFASGECKLSIIAGKAMHCDQLFHKAVRNNLPTSQSDFAQDFYNQLYNFHTCVTPSENLTKEMSSVATCVEFIAIVQHALYIAIVCVQSGNLAEAHSLVSEAKDMVAAHSNQSLVNGCSKGDHRAVSVRADAVQVWSTLSGETNLSDESLSQLNELSINLHMLTTPHFSRPAPSTLHKLIETLELVILSVLRTHKDCFISECSFQDNAIFGLVESLLTDTIICLDEFLKHPPHPHPTTLQQKGRARQLQLLRFLSDVLIELLTFGGDDGIETLRSSPAVPIPLPPPSPAPAKRENLAASCYSVLRQSQEILRKAGVVLCVSEHRWLGTDAYKIGLALLNRDELEEACDIFFISTEELTFWVAAGGPTEEAPARANEVRLLEIFLTMIDVQRKVCRPVAAMETVSRALLSLPLEHLSSSCINSLVDQWVKAKRELIISREEEASSSVAQSWVITMKVETFPLHLRKLLVETELRFCKTSSLSPTASLAVVDHLLSLYSLGDSSVDIIDKARITVEKAILSKGLGSTLHLLEDAAILLEPLACVSAYEQLAITHLWRVICVGEQQIMSHNRESKHSANADQGTLTKEDAEIEICLSPEQERMMMSDDIIQCLHSTVDCWEAMSQCMGINNLPSNDPSLTLQYLHLTAHLSLAHSQLDLALRSLQVLLNTVSLLPVSISTRTVKLTALADYCLLLDSVNGAGSTCTTVIGGTVLKDSPNEKSSRRELLELKIAQLNCKVSLSRTYLCQGRIEDSQEILLTILKDDSLKEPCSLTFDLVAKTKLLAADILQQKTSEVETTQKFIQNILDTPFHPTKEGSFSLTPLELVIDACRLFTKLADHKKVIETSSNQSQQGKTSAALIETANQHLSQTTDLTNCESPTFSSSVTAWQILVSVLDSLKTLSCAYLTQGNITKAYMKAREGAMMSKLTLLQGWYVEFLLLLVEIHTISGAHTFAQMHSTQAAKLLECQTCFYISSLMSAGGTNKGEDANLTQPVMTEPSEQEPQKVHRKTARKLKPTDSTHPVEERGSQTKDCLRSETGVGYPELSDVSLISMGTSTGSDSYSNESSYLITSPVSEGQDHSPPPPSYHPSNCLCTLCASIVFNTQVTRLVTLTCSQVLDGSLQAQTSTSQENTEKNIEQLVHVLKNLKEFLNQRKRKCDKKLKDLSTIIKRPESSQGKKPSIKKKLCPRPIDSCNSFMSTQLQLSLALCDCYVALMQPRLAIRTVEDCLSELRLPSSKDEWNRTSFLPLRELLAKAQYKLGVARIQEIECTSPEKAQQIWANVPQATLTCKDKENVGVRQTRTTHNRDSKVLSAVNTRVTSSGTSAVKQKLSTLLDTQAMEHLVLAYQLCRGVRPAHLLKGICRWLSVLLSTSDACVKLSPLFLSESIQTSLTHETILSLGVRIRNGTSKTPLQHAVETIEALVPHTDSSESHLHQARQSLLTESNRLSLSLPKTWAVCTICLSPKTHYSHPSRLIISRSITSKAKSVGQRSAVKRTVEKSRQSKEASTEYVYVKLELPCDGDVETFLGKFADLQRRSRESVAPCEIKQWWRVRRHLDKEMKELLERFECDYIGPLEELFSCPPNGSVILVLGEKIQSIPWESLSLLQNKSVCRMPSLKFMVAHKYMLNHSGSMIVDRQSAFYVLNPHGDLVKTESMFADLFRQQFGCDGVIGRSPTEQEFITALQDRDLYVFCGHNFGQFVSSTSFQQLSCNATTLLIGCSSGRLIERGRSDPHGVALNFLMSGCPSVVGCLWDVTDGDIDRFCWSLLTIKTTESTFFPVLVSSSRRACKLPFLTGAAPVVYGMPVAFRH